MADIEYREPSPAEAEAFWLPTVTAFGTHPDQEKTERWRPILGTGLAVGALDGERWVGGASAFVDRLVLPGGSTLPAALITMVGVLATHRRRGVLRGLMEHQLDAAAGQELPLAVLLASESAIYGRFGYGPATWAACYEIDTHKAAFAEPVSAAGSLRIVGKADALDPLHDAYDRCLTSRPGALGRSRGFWQKILDDPKGERGGASELFVLVHDDADGRPDGAATYRVKIDFPPGDNLAKGRLDLVDMFGVDPAVEAALWRTVLDVDLVQRVRAMSRPIDDPIRWRLAEPRQLRTTGITDWLWVRILDVPATLTARTYRASDRLVIDVVDAFRPATGGTYVLDTSGVTPACERSDASLQPELRIPISALGSLLLGGVTASALVAAGRIHAETGDVVRRADALFHSTLAPFTATDF